MELLKRRTDLALEARELLGKEAEGLPGVTCEETSAGGFPLTTVKITSPEGAKALGKPEGTYHTLDLAGLARREPEAFPRAVTALAGLLAPLLGQETAEDVLVVGLGNRAITPDAVGPKAADRTLVTRHMVRMAPEQFGSFRPVAALAAGVLGTTGVESGEIVKAVAGSISPKKIIAVDALASRSLDRGAKPVQAPGGQGARHGHLPRLRGGEPPLRPGRREPGGARHRRGGAHGGGRGHPGRRRAGGGGHGGV